MAILLWHSLPVLQIWKITHRFSIIENPCFRSFINNKLWQSWLMFYLLKFCLGESQIFSYHKKTLFLWEKATWHSSSYVFHCDFYDHMWHSLLSLLLFNCHGQSVGRLVFLLLSDQCPFFTPMVALHLLIATWIRECMVKSTIGWLYCVLGSSLSLLTFFFYWMSIKITDWLIDWHSWCLTARVASSSATNVRRFWRQYLRTEVW